MWEKYFEADMMGILSLVLTLRKHWGGLFTILVNCLPTYPTPMYSVYFVILASLQHYDLEHERVIENHYGRFSTFYYCRMTLEVI